MARNPIGREFLLSEIRRVAEEMGVTRIPLAQFRARTGLSLYHLYRNFSGWAEAVRHAGLCPAHTPKLTHAELLAAMRHAFIEAGGVVNVTRFNGFSRHGATLYYQRFGSWRSALNALREWIDTTGESFPYRDQLPQGSHAENEVPRRPRSPAPVVGADGLGELLHFRSLQHAPTNEQGVVLLFGMVCQDLGFVVETVRTRYPDCEAKRCFPRRRNPWHRVRIEFEFLSSGFRDGCHDPTGCDLVVCWIHDWVDCPVEVLELRSAVERLQALELRDRRGGALVRASAQRDPK